MCCFFNIQFVQSILINTFKEGRKIKILMIMILIIEDIKLMIYVPPENGFAKGYSKQFIIINVFLCIE